MYYVKMGNSILRDLHLLEHGIVEQTSSLILVFGNQSWLWPQYLLFQKKSKIDKGIIYTHFLKALLETGKTLFFF